MPLRHREQDLRVLKSGTYVSPIGPTTFTRFATDGFWRTCDDITEGDFVTPNDFQLKESYQFYPTLTCTNGGRSWTECPVGYQPVVPDPRAQHAALTGLDRNAWAWEILAKTNPSVPHVSVPTFIGEMKDLPGLIKTEGQSLLKALANGYLSARWAILPLANDLHKLLGFVKAVDDRTIMLMRLRAGATLRRRVQLGTTESWDPPQNLSVHSEGIGIFGTFRVRYASKAWGTAQWKLHPAAQLPTLGYGPLRDLAQKLTLGVTDRETLAMAWELTPWSWLADWLANTGDLIAATNNTVGCTWANVCYMRTSEAIRICTINTTTSHPVAVAGLRGQNYYLRMLRKERYVCAPVIPVPVPQLPILTSGQWSILAALAAQRL